LKLISIQVKKFRNFIDSGEVNIGPDITCLVGKNESGKTALLKSLYYLNPARGNMSLSVLEQYPAWIQKRDQSKRIVDEVKPITAVFELEEKDKEVFYKNFGEGIIGEKAQIVVTKDYGGNLSCQVNVNEKGFLKQVIDSIEWPHGTKTKARNTKTIQELLEYSESLEVGEERAFQPEDVQKLIDEKLAGKTLTESVEEFCLERLPKILYFSECEYLPYSTNILKILRERPESLNSSERTALSLLKLADADNSYLKGESYESRKRELENVANLITGDVLKFWSQNPDLRVSPDISQKTETDRDGKKTVLDELKIRIWDDRHKLSLPFNEHSTGFQWFFSFLVAFSEYEMSKEGIIILLDEPALGLHARAQKDFLRFIEERLALKNQVIYTTHSPFMVQPGHLERVRIVEEKNAEEGAKVSSEVTATDHDTIFPLQGALGYDLTQHLFIAPDNLVVEGTSDYTYLRVISDYFKSNGERTPLDARLSIVPVGGVDLVPTFVALLGNHLGVTVLIDSKKKGHQKLSKLTQQGILEDNKIITIGQLVGKPEADIEDLFETEEYLKFFNRAFEKEIDALDLTGDDPIVKRIARKLGQERFDHGTPADYFLKNRDKILEQLSEVTLERFEKLFQKINATLSN